MHKIGILSDTHNLLRPEVLQALAGCEAILHGGDISKPDVLGQLEQIAPVTVVRGNNDKEWAEHLPETVTIEMHGLRIFMVHNRKFIPKQLTDIDLVIFGHSHKYEDKMVGDVRCFNPGSCGPRRFGQEISMAILWIDEATAAKAEGKTDGKGCFRIEKVLIPHKEKNVPPSAEIGAPQIGEDETIPPNLALMLPAIMKEIREGKSVEQIAKKHKISPKLSREINRMYLTHPGVDVDGILRRLGL